MWTRSIPPAELALWRENGRRQFRVRMRRRGEVTWTNLSDVMGGDWVLGIRADIPTPDQVVAGFDVRLIRKAMDGATPRTVSPGISADPINRVGSEFRPFVRAGREIEVDARTGIGDSWQPWRLWLKGEVESTEWPGDEVLARCNTLDGVLLATQIEEEEERGRPDPGVPLAEEIQSLIDRWWDGPDRPTLRVIGNPELGVGEYRAAVGSLGELIRSLAQRRGWDVRYLWSEADQTYRLTLYLPPRDKTTPDYLLPVDEVFDVPGLSESRRWVRNAIRVTYVTEPGGQEQAVTVIDQDSIDEFRRQAMVVPLSEGNETPGTESQATALGNYALHDLSRPLIEARYRTRCNPFLELHDLLAIQADGARFDQDRLFGVVGGSHEVTADDSWTDLELSGGRITGQYFAWHRFEGLLAGEEPEAYRILAVDLVDETATHQTRRVLWGAKVKEAHLYVRQFDTPEPPPDWVELLYSEDAFSDILTTNGGTFTTVRPGEGTCLAWGVLPSRPSADGTRFPVIGDGWEDIVYGGIALVDLSADFVRISATTERMDVTVLDPRGVVSRVTVEEKLRNVTRGPISLAQSGGLYRHTYTLDPDHPLYLRVTAHRSDGVAPVVRNYVADFDEVPGIPDVREVRVADQVSVYVDAVDTDTVSLWYRPVVGSAPGAEVRIQPRGSDPRFGAFTVTASTEGELRYRVYGKARSGAVGEYRDVIVARHVPAPTTGTVLESVSEDGSTGTLTLTPVEGATFDQIEFSSRSGNGPWSAWTADTTPPYAHSVTLHPKHVSAIAYRVWKDGAIIQERIVLGFDLGTVANVLDVQVTEGGEGEAAIRALFDTDTSTGAGNARYRLDGGTPTAVAVAADRTAEWAVEQDTDAATLLEVSGRNGAGQWGPWFPRSVPRFRPSLPLGMQVTAANLYLGAEGGCGVFPMNHRLEVTIERLVNTGYHLDVAVSIDGEPFQPVTITGSIDPNNDTFDVFVNYPEFEVAGGSETPVKTFAYQVRAVHTLSGRTHPPVATNAISRRTRACA